MASQTQDRGAVMITGASTGIGKACAMRLDKLGFQVFAGVRKEADGQSLKAEASGRLSPLMLDVTDESSIASAARAVSKVVGERGLAGLVNNAGISVPGPIEFLPIEDVRRQIDVNVIGQIAVTQAFLLMIRQGRGRIVNIGSIGGRMATPFLGAYAASKFAMEAITDSLRMELRPWKIPVSIIEPGSIDTPLWQRGQTAADELQEKMPEDAGVLYGEAMDAMRKAADKFASRAIPPEAVAKVVVKALRAKRPKTRYLVGTDARIMAALVKVIPDGLRDAIVTSQLGLPKKK